VAADGQAKPTLPPRPAILPYFGHMTIFSQSENMTEAARLGAAKDTMSRIGRQLDKYTLAKLMGHLLACCSSATTKGRQPGLLTVGHEVS
jgi:hypothetical protein